MKLTTLRTALVVVTSILALSSCRKKPDAHFILSQYEYSAGDMIQYENLSTDFETCEWSIIGPDGSTVDTTVTGRHPNIVLGILSEDGAYSLKLRAMSKKEKKITEVEKLFLVKSTRGYLNINVNGSGDHDDYSVYVDGQYIGEALFNGAFQKQIPIGTRLVEIVDGSVTQTEVVEIDENNWVYLYF